MSAIDLHSELAKLLAGHRLSAHFNGFPESTPCRCSCGEEWVCEPFQSWVLCEDVHRVHLADLLAECVTTGQAQAVREAGAELARMMTGYPQGGRQTRATWAVGMLDILADRIVAVKP